MVKFGHQIAESTYGPWADQYVRYKALKKLIKLIVAATESLAGSVKTEDVVGKLGGKGLSDSEIGWLLERAEHSGGMVPLEVLEQAFQALLESDLARVAAFSVNQHAHLQSLLADSSPRKDTDTEAEVRERMGRRVEALAHQRLLLAYQDINYIAFFKIAKKHDKMSGGDRMLPMIMASVEQSSLAKGLLHGSGRTGEYAASLVPAYSGAASSQQIDRATRLSKQAVLKHAPERHFSEHDERLGSLDSVQSAGLVRLRQMEQSTSPHDALALVEQVTHIKADVFAGFIREVIDSVSTTDPETAAALEKLQSAHSTLFVQTAETTAAAGGTAKTTQSAETGKHDSAAGGSLCKSDSSWGREDDDTVDAGSEHSQELAMLVARLRSMLRQLIPGVLLWMPAYQWRRQLKADVVAGVTLAIMGLPQGLAYASLVGVDPVHGIFTVIFPPLIYSVLGHSRQGAVGPMSIPCLIIAAVVDEKVDPANPNSRLELTLELTMTIGVICFVAGLLRIGTLIDFISTPNLNGFVQASALMVMVSMTPKLMGVSVKKSSLLYEMAPRTIDALPDTKSNTLWFSLAGIVFMLMLTVAKTKSRSTVAALKSEKTPRAKERSLRRSVPERCALCVHTVLTFASPVLLFVSASLLTGWWVCDFEKLDGQSPVGSTNSFSNSSTLSTVGKVYCNDIRMVGELPSDIPSPQWSGTFTLQTFVEAMSITMVILAEHVANVKLYSIMHGYEVDQSAELMAIGVTNAFGALFQCFAVGARFTGSAVNNNVGATSQVSLFVSGATALALLPLITKVLYFLPGPTLSIVVVFAVAGVVKLKAWAKLWQSSRHDFFVMLASFAATLVLGVLSGLLVAIGVSLAIFILKATQPRMLELGRALRSVNYRDIEGDHVRRVSQAKILRFESPLAFFNVNALCDRLAEEFTAKHRYGEVDNLVSAAAAPQWHAILLDFSCIPWVDSTAAEVFTSAVRKLQETYGQPIALCNANHFCIGTLKSFGLSELIPDEHVFHSVHDGARAIALGRVILADASGNDDGVDGGSATGDDDRVDASDEAKGIFPATRAQEQP